jgi:uncharacterized tellurite resistance protein B-like protein
MIIAMEENKIMQEHFLNKFSEKEKGAYLSAIASIALADRSASEEEIKFLEELADTADLAEEERIKLRSAAVNTSEQELKHHLDTLKTSDLRFSLLADLIAFAESDADYSQAEKEQINKIGQYLGISREQAETIEEVVHKASTTEVSEEQVEKQGFLGALGLGDKFEKAGINSGISQSILGFAGPMILGALLSRGMGGRRGSAGMGGLLGGLAGGGLGGRMGRGRNNTGGAGLGSIISMLNGGRGMKGSSGMLERMFRR